MGVPELAVRHPLVPRLWRGILQLASFLAFSFFLSGPIRSLLHVSIDLGLGIALSLSTCAWAYLQSGRGSSPQPPISPRRQQHLLFGFIVGIFFAFLLFHRAYHGIVSVGGGDAGNHVHSLQIFISENPAANSGLVSFFSFVYWMMKLSSLSYFNAFSLFFFFTIVLSSLFQFYLLSCVPVPKDNSGVPQCLESIALVGFSAFFLWLPVASYIQAAGFFPQLSGILPSLLFILLSRRARLSYELLLTFLFLIFLLRFTYALHLADLAGIAGILFCFQAVESTRRREKKAARMLAVSFFFLSTFLFLKLSILFPLSGGILQSRTQLIGAALSLLGISALYFGQSLDAESRKTVRILGSFFMVSGIAQLGVILWSGDESAYYVQKYALLPLYLFGLCFPYLWKILRADAPQGRRRWELTFLLSTTFILCWLGIPSLRIAFWERISQSTVSQVVKPLIDQQAMNLISTLLQSEKKSFGGYLAPEWAQSNFMNAALGYYGELPLFRDARLSRVFPNCIFWRSDQTAMEELREQGLIRVIRKIEALAKDSASSEHTYLSSENGKELRVGHLCR